MLIPIITLPDGEEITIGKDGENAILSHTYTECVNSEEELTIGSTCSNMLEATIWNLGGGLFINSGDELILYKQPLNGERVKVGVFIAEKPTRPSRNTLKITCYDHVSKLDQDLTGWLLTLSGWPYTLLTFAKMVCEQCGLTLANDTLPNETFPVYKYSAANTTGRMLMQWLGQIAGRFCRADADGNVVFDWYKQSTANVSPDGSGDGGLFYYEGKLDYSDYTVEKVDLVQVQFGDSGDGYLYPEKEVGQNTYIIAGNPFLNSVASSRNTAVQSVSTYTSGEIIGYTFNGFGPLPALPSWDKVEYPYAYMAEAWYGYDLYMTTVPLVWTGGNYSSVDSNGNPVNKGLKYSYDPNNGNLWIFYGAFVTKPVTLYSDPIWVNVDMDVDKGSYGSFSLAASDPVPVYDEGDDGEDDDTEDDYSNASALDPYLKVILKKLNSYIDPYGNEVENVYIAPRPCKVEVPAQLETGAGYLIPILVRDQTTLFYCRCMTRVQKNQRDTLEGTGSARRDAVMAQSNSTTVSQTTKLTHGELLEILTNGGEVEGFIIDQGQIYFNGEYVTGPITIETKSGKMLTLSNAGITLGGLTIDYGSWYNISADDTLALTSPKLILNGNVANWTDNGDGTYTMTGTPVTE